MSNQDNTQAQIELEQYLQFQSLLAELSANFVSVPYFQCSTAWYTQAYGNTGVINMPVPAPY